MARTMRVPALRAAETAMLSKGCMMAGPAGLRNERVRKSAEDSKQAAETAGPCSTEVKRNVGTDPYCLGGDHPSRQHRRRGAGHEEHGPRASAAGESAVFSARRGDGARLGCGRSAGGRSIPWPAVDPRGAAQRALAAAPQGPVAIVFGREHSGLSNEELDRCNYLLHIPTNPDYSSLNLAAAVQVIAYELRMATQQGPVMPTDSTPLASFQERELFYGHLEEVLMELQFLDPNNPKHLMRRLRRLFNRVGLDQKEINILRGILTAVQRRGRTSLREEFR